MIKDSEIAMKTSPLKELYSKTTIGVFAMLFSALFAAIILSYNLRKLNYNKQSNIVLAFGLVYTITSLYVLYLINNNTNAAILLNLGGMYILTSTFWNKYLGKDYEYTPKKPLLLIIISLIIIAIIILLFLYGHLIMAQLY